MASHSSSVKVNTTQKSKQLLKIKIQWKEKIGRKFFFFLVFSYVQYTVVISIGLRTNDVTTTAMCSTTVLYNVYCALYSSLQTFKHELFEPSPLTTADSLYNFAPSLPHTSTSQHSLIVPCMQSCEAFRIRSSKNRIRIQNMFVKFCLNI